MAVLIHTTLAIVVLFVHCCAGHLQGDGVIRNTTLGQVLGSMGPPLPGMRTVEKFYGIPFAKPPVGDLRFELSNETTAEVGNLTGVPNGTRYGYMTNTPLAVLVFIHGGSNVVGTANMFDGDILAAVGEIIVVTINYRLATLGFLGNGEPEFPGNYGLLDMITALRWVQDNIASFNGDPSQVTVMGHSAASMDVGVLLISPLAKNLFRTVICQSGALTSIITSRWPGHNSTREILDLGLTLGCLETTLRGVKECLKTVDVVTLSKSYPVYDWYQFPAVVGDAVLPKMPKELLRNGNLNAETLLIGTTRDEAGKWALDLQGYNNISNILILHHILPGAIHFKDLVRFEYTDFSIPENDTTDVRIASRVYGDSLFDAPTVETLQILSNRTISLYQYRWEWRSAASGLPEFTGVPHGSDLFYLFGSPLRGHKLYNYTAQDENMSNIMMRQWSHFVKFGTFEINPEWPVQPTSDELLYKKDTRPYTRFYDINGTPAIGLGYNLKPREAAFWNSVIPDVKGQIERTLKNWNADKNTTKKPDEIVTVDVDAIGRQKELFLILFIIFLVLSCLLLLMLLFVCVVYCTSRNSTTYATK